MGEWLFFCLRLFKDFFRFHSEVSFPRHCSPWVFLSNNGFGFKAHIVTNLSLLFFTFLTFTSLYYPVTNGAFKRFNGTLALILHKTTAFLLFRLWILYAALLAYRISYSCVLGLSPFKAFYVIELTIVTSVLTIVDSFVLGFAENLMRLIFIEVF